MVVEGLRGEHLRYSIIPTFTCGNKNSHNQVYLDTLSNNFTSFIVYTFLSKFLFLFLLN